MPLSTKTTFWTDLLENIDEHRVIPIVGPELLCAAGSGLPIYFKLAEDLAKNLELSVSNIPAYGALNHVIARYLENGGRREDVYPRLRDILKDNPPAVPEPLKQLAGIRHFNLFVTTTFDLLLEQAINEVRFGGKPVTKTIVYRPSEVCDLPSAAARLSVPTVFHLMGRVSGAAGDYAVTDDDMLEFVSAMQNENGRPEVLFDELKKSHVLLMGCGFPDWLARFFIRVIKGERLSNQRNSQEIIADQIACKDANLVLFLKHYSYRTEMIPEGNAVEFVRELSRRHAQRSPALPASPAASVRTEARQMPSGAVFLSYAIQDLPVIRQLHAALSAEIDVWFDQQQLEGGDLFDAKIRRNIFGCSLFLPIISANTQSRPEGYFRKEWNLAAERTLSFHHEIPFIVPVCIDDTRSTDALVPAQFHNPHWMRLPGGVPTDDFVARIKKLFRESHKRDGGIA